MQLEKEQAIFKKERIRAERKIAAGQGEIEKAKRTEADFKRDLEYINSYNGAKATLLLNLPQASTEEVGRELPYRQDLPQRSVWYSWHVCRAKLVGA